MTRMGNRWNGDRTRLRRTLALTVLLVLAIGGVASAKWDVFRVGNVILKFDGGLMPRALPKDELGRVGVYGKGQISTTDGSHPPAFREGLFEIDRNVAVEAGGLPTCDAGQLEARDSRAARRVCGDSIVGAGEANVRISFPEQEPIFVYSPITFFNGGVRGSTTTMFVHAYITVPVPAAIVTTVTFRKVSNGRYGTRVFVKTPVIAGGSGSAIDFEFRIKRFFNHQGEKRSYLMGKCPDGHINFKIIKAVFKGEVGERSVSAPLSGTLIRPCIPKK